MSTVEDIEAEKNKNVFNLIYIYIYTYGEEAHGSVVVKALCYKPESLGIETV
jgi:hypothetical protein